MATAYAGGLPRDGIPHPTQNPTAHSGSRLLVQDPTGCCAGHPAFPAFHARVRPAAPHGRACSTAASRRRGLRTRRFRSRRRRRLAVDRGRSRACGRWPPGAPARQGPCRKRGKKRGWGAVWRRYRHRRAAWVRVCFCVVRGYGRICRCYGRICRGYGRICLGYGRICRGYGRICRGYGRISRGLTPCNKSSPRSELSKWYASPRLPRGPRQVPR